MNKQTYLYNHKFITINQWKQRGIIDDDFDALYDYYMKETNCWICKSTSMGGRFLSLNFTFGVCLFFFCSFSEIISAIF